MWRVASTKVGSHSWWLSLGPPLSGPLTKGAKSFHRKILPYKDLKDEFHLCLPAAHCQPEPTGSLLLTSCALVPFAKAHSQGDGPLWSREHVGGQPARAPGTRVPVLAMLLPGCSSFAYWQLTLFQISFKVALYYRRNAELNISREERKQESQGGRKKWSWEWENHKYNPLFPWIWPDLTLSFLVARRNRNALGKLLISKSQLRYW